MSPSVAPQTVQSAAVIENHHNAKLVTYKTKKKLLQRAKSLHTAVYSDTEGNEYDPELSPPSTMDAGNNGHTESATKQSQLAFGPDTMRRTTGIGGSSVDEDDDKDIIYFQEEVDSGEFVFNKDEALFVRLVECVRKYALENRLNNGSALWPVELHFFNPLRLIINLNASVLDIQWYRKFSIRSQPRYSISTLCPLSLIAPFMLTGKKSIKIARYFDHKCSTMMYELVLLFCCSGLQGSHGMRTHERHLMIKSSVFCYFVL